MTSKLSEIQQHFQNYLMFNEEDTFAQDVVNDEKVGNITRMRVYFEGYRLRLYEVLMQDYPKVVALMGEEAFQKSFILYVDIYPSNHFSVRYFGRHYAQFLATHPNYSDTPWLAEMARFEWLIQETLDAADKTTVSTQFLQSLQPEQWADLCLHLHPSLRFNTFEYDTAKTWLKLDKKESVDTVAKLDTPQTWIFWRKGLQSLFESCSIEECYIFAGLTQGLDFAQICESCIPFIEETQIPPLAAQSIYKWCEQEMLVR